MRGRRPDGGETARPVALLLARHWQPTYDYAVICLASSGNVASMAAAAAFREVLESRGRRQSAEALRPRLLVAVRDIVKAWSADDGVSGVLPEVRKSAGARGMRAVKSTTPGNRELAERSFRDLSGPAQCLLWHTEVEAEPISVPAGLLAMDADTAAAVLEQAREQFRAGCVRAHREQAPSRDCRFYNRLLDIPIRRGGALLPDVQQHLLECRHCRYAAEQLSLCRGGLGVLLTEAVLGRGARRYLESRPGRGAHGVHPQESGGRGGRRRPESGRHRLLQHPTTLPGLPFVPSWNHSKPVLAGLGLVSAVVLSTVLATSLGSDDGRGPGPAAASTGATGSQVESPGRPSPLVPSTVAPPATSAGFPGVSGHARLRNAATDLCLDIRGDEAKPGVGTRMAECSSGKNQQWSYGSDGLLRSLADLELCLDSRADDGAVTLAGCQGPSAAHVDELRYDLTVQGQLLPRWDEGLAVVPTSVAKGADVVVKLRNASVEQKWVLDSSPFAPRSQQNAGPGDPSAKAVPDVPPPAGKGCGVPACEPSPPGGRKHTVPERVGEKVPPDHQKKRHAEAEPRVRDGDVEAGDSRRADEAAEISIVQAVHGRSPENDLAASVVAPSGASVRIELSN